MRKSLPVFIGLLLLIPLGSLGEEREAFPVVAENSEEPGVFRLKSNVLPWALAVPNIGAEWAFGRNWSVDVQVLYCPWNISNKFSVKTVAIFPEGRWWLRTNRKGSFFNVHLNVAWFNVRANSYRYQDVRRPLLGGGIGYGYRLEFNSRWGMEFEIGAGMANARYDRYYNVENGALKDTRVSTYWGIDRVGVTFTYNLCDI